jgi:glycosyltransferase involved in cell wall biosynthesis
MEASSVTGPAKNLIGFCRWAHSAEGAAAGLQISIATFDRGIGRQGFADAAREAGITTYVIHERRRFDRSVFRQLAQIVKKAVPDLIQTHNSKSHVLLKQFKRSPATPWVAFQHGYQSTDLKLRLYNQLDRWTLRSADRVVSVCQAFTGRLIAYGVQPQRICVLHNSVSPTEPVPQAAKIELRQRFGILGDQAVILTIGRFSKEKGHADLIEALHRIPATARRWRAILVGEGPERANLERLISRLNLADVVTLAGVFPDVRPLYGIADIFALPSHSEGSSNVILEAMAAKVPIVATRVGGTPEILTDGDTALLCADRDPLALGQSIERVLGDDALAKGLAASAFNRVQTRFSPERYRQTLVAIYADALGVAGPIGSHGV